MKLLSCTSSCQSIHFRVETPHPLLTRWQSPPERTSWMKTAGPSGRLEPPPIVIPRLQERATEINWMTPSPGWLKNANTCRENYFHRMRNIWCGNTVDTVFYLRERIRGPLLLYAFWDPAGLNSNGLWERDEEPDDVLSRYWLPFQLAGK